MFGNQKYLNLITVCIRRAALIHKIKIIELNIQPEHVYCVVEVSLTVSPTIALQYLKGVSARLFFQFHKRARLRYSKGQLWSPGKFAASLGFIQLNVAKEYVRNQDAHHTRRLAL